MRTLRIVIIIAGLVASVDAFAQYNESVWPAWSHPRDQKYQLLDLYSGVYERVDVIWPYYARPSLPSPAWYRINRSLLTAWKSALVNNVSDFGDTPPSLSLFCNPALWTNSLDIGGPTGYNKITLCQAAQIPTNYFDYTPWRGISGVGGYTNDAAVIGHSHGETNSETAKGGTNFPAGRTCWYTTDYGLDELKTVLSLLTHVKIQSEMRDSNIADWNGASAGGYDLTNMPMSKTKAETAWPIVYTNGYRIYSPFVTVSAGVNQGGSGYGTTLYRSKYAFTAPGINAWTHPAIAQVFVTNYGHTVSFYVLGRTLSATWTWMSPIVSDEFDTMGDSIATNAYTIQSVSAESYAPVVTSTVFSSLDIPTWFSSPDETAYLDNYVRGYGLHKVLMLVEWNFPHQ